MRGLPALENRARTSTAVVLAAHGSRRDPRARALIEGHVRRLRQIKGISEVTAAYRQGEPTFSQVLDRLRCERTVIVPYFLADGYFARTLLPRELARNRRYDPQRVSFTPVVGTCPELRETAQRRLEGLARLFGLRLGRTLLLVVGHGTRRQPASRITTEALTAHLAGQGLVESAQCAFLDEPPRLEDALQPLLKRASKLRMDGLVVLPFMIGGSHHVRSDIPRRLGLQIESQQALPAAGRIAGVPTVYDQALGCDPAMKQVIARLVLGALRPAASLSQESLEYGDGSEAVQVEASI